jgi:hypothetical protein
VDFGQQFKDIISRNFFSYLSSGKKTKANQAGKINLFALFIMQGMFLTKDKGVLSFIVPNNILRTTTYNLIRKFIIDKYSLEYIADLGAGIFENVTASTVLFSLSNNKNSKNFKILTDINSLEYHNYSLKFANQNSYLNNISYAYNIYTDPESQKVIDKIMQGSKPFGDYCIDIIEGIVAHKELILDNATQSTFPLVEGKTVKRYYLQKINKHIIWDSEKIHRKRPDYLWQEPKKIIMQRISGGLMPLVATIDKDRNKAFASTNNIVLHSRYSQLYNFFVALLNSELILNLFQLKE